MNNKHCWAQMNAYALSFKSGVKKSDSKLKSKLWKIININHIVMILEQHVIGEYEGVRFFGYD